MEGLKQGSNLWSARQFYTLSCPYVLESSHIASSFYRQWKKMIEDKLGTNLISLKNSSCERYGFDIQSGPLTWPFRVQSLKINSENVIIHIGEGVFRNLYFQSQVWQFFSFFYRFNVHNVKVTAPGNWLWPI